jgi:hypothetical protein
LSGGHSYLPQVYEVCQEDILTYNRYMRFVRRTFLLTTGIWGLSGGHSYLQQVYEVCQEDILTYNRYLRFVRRTFLLTTGIWGLSGGHSYLQQVYEVCQEDILTYNRYMRFVRRTFLLTTGIWGLSGRESPLIKTEDSLMFGCFCDKGSFKIVWFSANILINISFWNDNKTKYQTLNPEPNTIPYYLSFNSKCSCMPYKYKVPPWGPISASYQFILCHIDIINLRIRLRVMVFHATFNNISAISCRSVLLVGERGVTGEKHWPVTSHWQTLSDNVVSSTPRHERDSNSQRLWW